MPGPAVSFMIYSFLLDGQIYRERKNKALPATGSLLKWPQWPETNKCETRSFTRASHMGSGSLDLELSAAFPGHKQEADWEVEEVGHKPVPTRDPNLAGGGLVN